METSWDQGNWRVKITKEAQIRDSKRIAMDNG